MKHIYIILLLLISCSREAGTNDIQEIDVIIDTNINTKETNPAIELKPLISLSIKPDSTFENLEQIETEFLEIIEQIETSDTSNRKDLLNQFLTYSDKVDGAPAQTYFYFAHDYVLNNAVKFFEVLTIDDFNLIAGWAKLAAKEITLHEYNEEKGEDAYQHFSTSVLRQTVNLSESKRYIVDLFLGNLN